MKEDKKGRLLTKEELINEALMYAEKALKEHIPVVAIDPMRPTIDTPQVTLYQEWTCDKFNRYVKLFMEIAEPYEKRIAELESTCMDLHESIDLISSL